MWMVWFDDYHMLNAHREVPAIQNLVNEKETFTPNFGQSELRTEVYGHPELHANEEVAIKFQ